MWSIGLDIGQAQDPSAIAAVQAIGAKRLVRHLERVPLGTRYGSVLARVGTIRKAIPGARLVMDASGVGRPLYEALGGSAVGVTITGGKTVSRGPDGLWRVPKRILIKGLISTLEAGDLEIAAGLEYAPALKTELQNFARMLTAKGTAKMEARTGHDDLVLALALALWLPPALARA